MAPGATDLKPDARVLFAIYWNESVYLEYNVMLIRYRQWSSTLGHNRDVVFGPLGFPHFFM